MQAADLPQKSSESLNLKLASIRELLNRQRVVETMVHSAENVKQELVDSVTHRQNLALLQRRLRSLHIADIAYILDNLAPDERLAVWTELESRQSEILAEVQDITRKQLIENTPRDVLQKILLATDADDLSYFADDIPTELLNEVLQTLSQEQRRWVESSLAYSPDRIGYYMSPVFVTVRDSETLGDVLSHLRQKRELPQHTDKLFVLDRRGLLKGVVTLQQILVNEPDRKVEELLASDIVIFRDDDDATDAAQAFERYDLVSAPVVNERGKLLGRITVDVMMDFLRQQRSDELLKIAGLHKEEDPFLTIWNAARNRWLWISMNIATAFIASRIIGLFEASIEQLVALAALMPIVASIGGNTGNQTTALVLRAIVLDQLSAGNVIRLVRKEFGVGLINGLIFGFVVGLFAFIVYGSPALGVVIAVAMLLNLMVAAAVGLGVPLLLQRMGRDPALGSSVLLTATTDSVGFFLFLGLATIFLL